MYFDENNEKQAQKLEKDLNKQYAKLYKEAWKKEGKGQDASDIYERIGEISKSLDDILDMRNETNIEFKYEKASNKANPAGKGNPVTAKSGTNDQGHVVISMYSDSKGTKVHEGRHGGQVARKEYSFDAQGNPTTGYGLNSEVSAYRAQYGFEGKLVYIDATLELNIDIAKQGMMPTTSTVTNMNTIDRTFVQTKIGERRSMTYKNKTHHGLVPIYKDLK